MYILSIMMGIAIIWYICSSVITAIFVVVMKKAEKQNVNKEKETSADSQSKYTNIKKKFIHGCGNFIGGWLRYRLIRLGRFPWHLYRKFILRNLYQMDIAPNVVIYGGFEFRSPWNISIGKGTIIGDDAKLDGRNGIIIGQNVNFSTGVWVWTEQHDVNDSGFDTKGGMVQIDDYAWISSRCTVLPNVHISTAAVAAAGAVITKDCVSYGIYGGIPAHQIGERNHDLKYQFTGSHLYFY